MLLDHMGYILFPKCQFLRIIGRIAFPIFAFMIAEGCYYTRNKARYFLGIFSLALLCQIVYFAFAGSLDMGILVTFSMSILVIYTLQNVKETLCMPHSSYKKKALAIGLFVSLIALVYLINIYVSIDYGFWGVATAVLASVFRKTKKYFSAFLEKADRLYIHVLMMAIGLLFVSANLRGVQFYSFLSLPLILLYSGERGRGNMKSFFYIFYPAHLAVLYLISSI